MTDWLREAKRNQSSNRGPRKCAFNNNSTWRSYRDTLGQSKDDLGVVMGTEYGEQDVVTPHHLLEHAQDLTN